MGGQGLLEQPESSEAARRYARAPGARWRKTGRRGERKLGQVGSRLAFVGEGGGSEVEAAWAAR